ncbi:AAA family ATPase [Mycoplasmopsis felifaucium]|uniref:AAA family ATPase n=1 Tax=Mycoplasmopsis felifaucium TaxID=35768 RepID=UPI000691A504|nr:AAA family ATPase [Mycoplasmopsis felifaucium]
MNNFLNLKGRFRKILSGGPDKNWAYAFCSFVDENSKSYSVYMKKTKIELETYYNIEITPQTNRNTYMLESVSVYKPESSLEIKNLILTNVSGLGAVTMEKIERHLGTEIWETLLENPEQVQKELKSAVYDNLKKFCETYKNDSLSFFVDNNLTLFHSKLIQVFGQQNFIEIFKKEDPYDLYIDYNFDFTEVDTFAKLIDPNISINKRIRAFIYKTFRELMMNNNTCFTTSEIFNLTYKTLKEFNVAVTSYDELTIVVQSMIKNRELYYDNLTSRISLLTTRNKENFIAKKLFELSSSKDRNNYDIKYSESFSENQKKAYETALKEKISIISGYPGTGKSYVISHIIRTLIDGKHYSKEEIALLAPTGRAATILSKKCPIEARTIHSYLKLSKDDELIESYEQNSDAKVVIIDEFSMVNLNIFYLLLDICKKIEKLVIVGDENQLQCIGPGNLLHDLIESKRFKLTKLNEVYRTEKLDIFNHFVDINRNKIPILQSDCVSFIEYNNSEFLKQIPYIYEDKVKQYGIDNVVLLLPAYIGSVGINAVNSILQSWNVAYSGLKDNLILETKNNKHTFFIGDKVIQLVNDYDKNVFNGEIGYVTSINNATKEIKVDFGTKVVEYSKSEILENLKLAYAITIHKFQGSEASCVIFGIFKKQVEHMLTKKLLYTAVSRAKDELMLLGSSTLYIEKIVNSVYENPIYTNISEFLKE